MNETKTEPEPGARTADASPVRAGEAAGGPGRRQQSGIHGRRLLVSGAEPRGQWGLGRGRDPVRGLGRGRALRCPGGGAWAGSGDCLVVTGEVLAFGWARRVCVRGRVRARARGARWRPSV